MKLKTQALKNYHPAKYVGLMSLVAKIGMNDINPFIFYKDRVPSNFRITQVSSSDRNAKHCTRRIRV